MTSWEGGDELTKDLQDKYTKVGPQNSEWMLELLFAYNSLKKGNESISRGGRRGSSEGLVVGGNGPFRMLRRGVLLLLADDIREKLFTSLILEEDDEIS